MNKKRGSFSSRIGFVLAAAGSQQSMAAVRSCSSTSFWL